MTFKPLHIAIITLITLGLGIFIGSMFLNKQETSAPNIKYMEKDPLVVEKIVYRDKLVQAPVEKEEVEVIASDKTTEEVLTAKEVAFKKHSNMINISDNFSMDVVDPDWSIDTSYKITTILNQEGLPDFFYKTNIRDVDCRSKSCKFIVDHDKGDAGLVTAQLPKVFVDSSLSGKFAFEQGDKNSTYYLIRQ